MNAYPKRTLYAALAAAGFLASGASQAVNVSPDGRGDVLLYPYYTTRADNAGNAYATLLSVVNATPLAKAVRVRFLEGRNSRSVLDFNLLLSPFDVWTAAVLPDTRTGGAKIGTLDLSCTMPPFSSSQTAPFVSFDNASYSGVNVDGAGTLFDRTREGHFEVIEMATYASSSVTGKAVTHVNGIPACGTPDTSGFPPFPTIPIMDSQAAADAQPPSGGLFGTSTLINVNSGTDYSYDALALANFYQLGPNYQSPGAPLPDLTQASPPVSSVYTVNGTLYESAWTSGADAVSAVLMHDSLLNEFVLDVGTSSQTDWVVTMPTKRHYVGVGASNATKLFQRNFNGTAGSCDDFALSLWDREERRRAYPESGTPPPQEGYALCWGANVVRFDRTFTGAPAVRSDVLGSSNGPRRMSPSETDSLSGDSVPSPFENGWMNLTFPVSPSLATFNVHRLVNFGSTSISGRGQMTTGNTVTYVGLPVIGFAAVSYANGTLAVGSQNVLSNYGGSFTHKTTTLIQ